MGESLKTMCDSIQKQQQTGKKHQNEDMFGVFVASQLKCMIPAPKTRAKYHINNMIFQAIMVDEGSYPSVQQHPPFMPDFSQLSKCSNRSGEILINLKYHSRSQGEVRDQEYDNIHMFSLP